MKANIKKETSILLSIGLIVKNEEKYLDQCLSALKPIQKAIPTEIVIVDTGSTDKTVEIAKKYTDKVYFFEWIDDFAAARNYGLERCVGEWYMFLDADEVIENDVSDLVDFFKSKKCDKYNSARIHLKNFEDDRLEDYLESLPIRLVKKTEKTRFLRKIHEYLEIFEKVKIYNIKIYAKHYGYIGSTKKRKLERNLEILRKEYEENPNSITTVSYLYMSTKDVKEKGEYLEKWIELEEKASPVISGHCLICAIKYYVHFDLNKATKYAEIFIDNEQYNKEFAMLSVCFILSIAYVSLGDYTKALKYLNMYFEYYKKYLNNELTYFIDTEFVGIQEYEYERQKLALALCYVKQKDINNAKESIKDLNIAIAPSSSKDFYSNALCEVLSFDFKPDFFEKYYLDFKEKFSEENDIFLEKCYWKIYKSTPDKINLYLKTISKHNKDNYMGIMFDILLNAKDENELKILLQSFIDNIQGLKEEYSPIIFKALSYSCDFSECLSKSNRKDIVNTCAALYCNLSANEYKDIAVNYVNDHNFETLGQLCFSIILLDPIKEMDSEIYMLYASLLANYVTNVYSEDALNEEDISMLPVNDQFGYYIYLADKAKNEGNDLEYIRALRKALKAEPTFKETVEEITEELGERLFEGKDNE